MTEKTDVLTVSDVEKLISKFSYKPNFQFTIYTSGDGIAIRVTMWTLNARQTYPPAREWLGPLTTKDPLQQVNSLIKVGRFVPVPEIVLESGETFFWQWFRGAVVGSLEEHEIDEWFQIDGTPVRDPHGETR